MYKISFIADPSLECMLVHPHSYSKPQTWHKHIGCVNTTALGSWLSDITASALIRITSKKLGKKTTVMANDRRMNRKRSIKYYYRYVY